MTLTRGAAPSGGSGYVITNVTKSALTGVLNDTVNSFTGTTVGASYTVDAWVRTRDNVGTTVGLREMEYAGRTYAGQAQSTIWLRDTAWHHITTTYIATADGAQIDVNFLDWSMPGRKSFDVASIRLSALGTSSQVSSPAPQPPSSSTAPPSSSSVPTTSSAPPTSSSPTTSSVPTTTTAAPPTSTTATPSPTPTQTSTAPPGYHLVWSDEFNDTSLNTNDWTVLNNSTYGDGNGELACLMNRPENIGEADGKLYIRAQYESTPFKCGSNDTRFPNGRSYTSAMINTQNKHAYKYGYFEIRAKLPTQANTSKGLWPAFWLRPQSGSLGELDVLEAIGGDSTNTSEANKVHQTIWYDYSGTYPRQGYTYSFPSGSTPSDGFHTYAIRWEPGLMEWLVDGTVTYTRTAATTSWLDAAFNQPFYFRINMAIGGSWPGAPNSSTVFPQSYYLDYIRIYQQ